MFNTQTASLKELRAFVADNDIFVDGDRRKKAPFIEAIDAWYHETSYYENDDEVFVANISKSNGNIADNDIKDITIDDLTNLPDELGEFDISIEQLENADNYSLSDNVIKHEGTLDPWLSKAKNITSIEPINSRTNILPILVIALPVYVISTTIIAILALVVRCTPKVIHWFEWGLTGFLSSMAEAIEYLFGDKYDDELDNHYHQVKELFGSS
ncbi:MAG: hypothetical protein AB4368_23580 [Xenococcaceae cyanobacterium]